MALLVLSSWGENTTTKRPHKQQYKQIKERNKKQTKLLRHPKDFYSYR